MPTLRHKTTIQGWIVPAGSVGHHKGALKSEMPSEYPTEEAIPYLASLKCLLLSRPQEKGLGFTNPALLLHSRQHGNSFS